MYKNHNSLLHGLGVSVLCYCSYVNFVQSTIQNYKRYPHEISYVPVDQSRWGEVQCTKNITLFCRIMELLPFVIFKICPEHNINNVRDINLHPFLNKRLFGEHPSVVSILLFIHCLLLLPLFGGNFVIGPCFVVLGIFLCLPCQSRETYWFPHAYVCPSDQTRICKKG